MTLKSYSNFERINAPLYLAPKGSLEEALHMVSYEIGEQNLFLNLQHSEEWLARPLPFRFANHVNVDYGFWQRISVPYQFDGVFLLIKLIRLIICINSSDRCTELIRNIGIRTFK